MILDNTANVGVVLVEPRIPQNTGNIARLCACTGTRVYLIGDLGFRLGDKYLERAGMDYLKGIPLEHFSEFEAVMTLNPGWRPYYVSTKAKQSYTDVLYDDRVLLVFGREDRGLPDWIIDENPTSSVRIPMVEGARSLNIANAAAIVLYEVLRQHRSKKPGNDSPAEKVEIL